MKAEIDLTIDLWKQLNCLYPEDVYGANELQATWTICLNPFISLQPLRVRTLEHKKAEMIDEAFALNIAEETSVHRLGKDGYGGTIAIDTDVPSVFLVNKKAETEYCFWSPKVVRLSDVKK